MCCVLCACVSYSLWSMQRENDGYYAYLFLRRDVQIEKQNKHVDGIIYPFIFNESISSRVMWTLNTPAILTFFSFLGRFFWKIEENDGLGFRAKYVSNAVSNWKRGLAHADGTLGTRTWSILRLQKLCDDKVVFSMPMEIGIATKKKRTKSIGYFKWPYKWPLTVQSSKSISSAAIHSRVNRLNFLDVQVTTQLQMTAIPLPSPVAGRCLFSISRRERKRGNRYGFYISLFRKEWTRLNAVCSQSPPTDIFIKLFHVFCVRQWPLSPLSMRRRNVDAFGASDAFL